MGTPFPQDLRAGHPSQSTRKIASSLLRLWGPSSVPTAVSLAIVTGLGTSSGVPSYRPQHW